MSATGSCRSRATGRRATSAPGASRSWEPREGTPRPRPDDSMTELRISRTELTAAQISEVLALVKAARLADGVAPLSEHGMLHLRYDSVSQSGASPPGTGDFVAAAAGSAAR